MSTYHELDQETSTDIHERRSFAFDFKLSTYIIKPLVDAVCKELNWNEVKIYNAIKDFVSSSIIWPQNYFPKDGFAYGYPKHNNVGRLNYIAIGRPLLR